MKEFEGKVWITLTSLIRYIANHAENLEICGKIVRYIIQCIVKSDPVPQCSILVIYQRIAKLNSVVWSDTLLETVQIGDSRTLYTNYKSCFSEKEWKKICLFEHHYLRNYPEYYTYEEELRKKETYLNKLIDAGKFAENVGKGCERTLTLNQSCNFTAEELTGSNFEFSGTIHSYAKVDTAISNILLSYNVHDSPCVSVACQKSVCGSDEGIHVYIETDDKLNLGEISSIISCDLRKLHKLFVHSDVFLKPNAFTQYSCKKISTRKIHRHELQDDFFLKKNC